MPEEEKTPEQWRELLRATYDYPDEIQDAPRRRRRRLRRAHRHAERERTTEWIREQRRREPTTPAVALVVVAVVLVAGVLARFGPDWFSSDDRAGNVTASAPPSPTGDQDAKPAGTASADPPAAASPSPSAVDLSDADTVAEQFTRHYLTRNPPVDNDHTAAVRRAAPWAMPALVENLANSTDPAWGKLVSQGGVSTVSAVAVKPAGDDLPPDTPLRVWRTVTATVDVAGYTDNTQKTTLQTELTNTGDGWRVSRILGV
ncbi:hypothetical protein [Streptomyces microflavus]|uniref:hypothetical protein n=1 Tax=Streptomyces microflavus TaxID=1919 RepID=UPI0037F392B0